LASITFLVFAKKKLRPRTRTHILTHHASTFHLLPSLTAWAAWRLAVSDDGLREPDAAWSTCIDFLLRHLSVWSYTKSVPILQWSCASTSLSSAWKARTLKNLATSRLLLFNCTFSRLDIRLASYTFLKLSTATCSRIERTQ
jgi:hypothetical protein